MRSAWMIAFFAALIAFPDSNPRAVAFQTPIESPVKNGSFEKWTDGKPDQWKIEIGAFRGGKLPASTVTRADGPSLQFQGDRSTKGWNFAMQEVTLEPGMSYQLKFAARATGIKLEADQFDNCYGGIFLKDANGQNAKQILSTVDWTDFATESLIFTVPAGVTKGQLFFFLSKTGTLNIKDVSLTQFGAGDSFELLVADMDRNYSHFDHKKIDWKELTDRYRQRANDARNADEFVEVISEMLAEMKDGHIWIIHNGKQIQKYNPGFDPNFDFAAVDKQLKNKKVVGDFAVVGRTEDGFGYVRIVKLFGVDEKSLKQLATEIENLFDMPGMIVDLRRNQGALSLWRRRLPGCSRRKSWFMPRTNFVPGPATTLSANTRRGFLSRPRAKPIPSRLSV